MTEDEARRKEAEDLADYHDRLEEWPSGALWTSEPMALDVLWYPTDASDDGAV